MDRMNPLDAEFLYLEDGTAHMHIASCAIFEGPAPAYEELVERIRSKLPLVPRYRQRVRFVPMDLRARSGSTTRTSTSSTTCATAPCHPRRQGRAVPAHGPADVPGAGPDPAAVGGLGRRGPGGRAVGGRQQGAPLHGRRSRRRRPHVGRARPRARTGAGGRGRLGAGARAVGAAAGGRRRRQHRRQPERATAGGVDGLHAPRRALAQGWTIAAGLLSYGSALRPTPPTSLDGTIGPHRRWTYAGASLADVRTIRHALGGTVNDVVLAAVTSGFRDLVLARGEDPDHVALRTLVPVSVRGETGHGVYDNQVSAIFLDLPVHIDDPLERLAAVHEEMDRLKGSHEAEAGQALTQLAGAVPPAFMAQGTRLVSRLVSRVPQRTMNTVTTNVPGPQFPLYFAGREMLEYLPYVPLGPGVRIGVAILSYNGQLHFGVTGDYDTAPDIGVLADGIDAAVATLRRLAGDGSANRAGVGPAPARPTGTRKATHPKATAPS